jgi:histidinol-phosphate phosphatase family protein
MSCATPRLRAVFLDRDGVINRKLPSDHYVKSPVEFEILPRVPQAMAMIKNLGFLLVVVTNQRGIARGFMTEDDLAAVHLFMADELKKAGAELDGIYTCPHRDEDFCQCRKPKPGMLLAAAARLGVVLSSSFMVGDSASDIAAGKEAGTMTVRIRSEEDPDADFTFPGLWDFALHLRGSAHPVPSPPAFPEPFPPHKEHDQ